MSSKVQIAETNDVFEAAADETILAAATRAGVSLPHECTFGGCGTCRVKLREGKVRYEEFPMALSEADEQAGFALACQAHALSDLIIEPTAGKLTFPPTVTVSAKVTEIRSLTQDITHLTLRLPDDAPLAYRPGQYMNIVLPDGSTRSFSMASAALPDNQVDFHIRHVQGGYFTGETLPRLTSADTLLVQIPLGTFCYRADDWRPMILAATGTGIAPLKAILESLLDDDDCPPVSLYWGMRTQADLYLTHLVESWRDRLYDFHFIPVLSRADDTWTGRRGYVQDAIVQDYDDLSEHAFYLCGAPRMIDAAKHMFTERGAQLDYFYSDSFTFQHSAAVAI